MNWKSFKIALCAGVMALTLAACGTAPRKDPVLPYEGSVRIDNKVAAAAQTAADAQADLARIQIARTKPAPAPLDETNLPEELKRPATLSWAGPAEDAARRIAALVGYSFQITGNPPSVPPAIQIDVKDVTAAMALYQIGVQAYPFGAVAVDTASKRVEFTYLQAQQQPVSPKGVSPSWGK
jgi:hypothetical protein